MAGRFLAIQIWHWTWLENLKYPYLPTLVKTHMEIRIQLYNFFDPIMAGSSLNYLHLHLVVSRICPTNAR